MQLARKTRSAVIDIETCWNPDLFEMAWKIAQERNENENKRTELTEDAVRTEMGFDPLFGRIGAVGIRSLGEDGCAIIDAKDEQVLLKNTWDCLREFDTIVTFNGISFDIPYLQLRSRINGVEPSMFIATNPYNPGNHHDLYNLLTDKKGNRTKWLRKDLRTVCALLGIEFPEEPFPKEETQNYVHAMLYGSGDEKKEARQLVIDHLKNDLDVTLEVALRVGAIVEANERIPAPVEEKVPF